MSQYSKEIDYKRPSLLQIYLTVKIYLTCLKCIKFRVLTKNYVLFVSHSLKSKNLNTTSIRYPPAIGLSWPEASTYEGEKNLSTSNVISNDGQAKILPWFFHMFCRCRCLFSLVIDLFSLYVLFSQRPRDGTPEKCYFQTSSSWMHPPPPPRGMHMHMNALFKGKFF